MITSAKQEVQFLVSLMKQAGITHVVLSPGSRNAPLTIAFDEDPFFTVFVITDERSAAFYALGMAQQLGKPVAVACTSGSAPLNYFPAVVEAYYQQIPLLVLTADRPTEWIDHGDGQTIRQQNVFGSHVLDSFHLEEFYNADKKWQAQLRCSELLQKAYYQKGPVQINLPFSEPLYQQVNFVADSEPKLVKRFPAVRSLSDDLKSDLSALLKLSKKRLIIVGQKRPDKQVDQLLLDLSEQDSLVVLTEHTSNVSGKKLIEPIDSVLARIGSDSSFHPDLIFQVGGAIVSKRIKKYLRDSGAKVITIDQQFDFSDTFHGLYLSVNADPESVLQFVLDDCIKTPVISDYSERWITALIETQQIHKRFSETVEYSDFKVVETILEALPANTKVHFSNSSMIRYGLLFPNSFKGEMYCNRGTSGIDGCTSTAAGAALADPGTLHVLVTGDLSFFYDSNALWNKHLPSNLRIIVVNNGGGDIFNIIPGPATTNQLGKVFVAEHTFKTKGICEGFDVEYQMTAALSELKNALSQLVVPAKNKRAKVLEIDTIDHGNAAVLKKYFEEITRG
jgi:2-succinyl-5-enolpyruvyl-6-hydroxy-3-cyclohexene-1-carboxylate synthase